MQVGEMRPVVGYEGLYCVGDDGRIYSVPKVTVGRPGSYRHRPGAFKVAAVTPAGFLKVILWKDGRMKNHLVHRLVAEAFVPNPESKPEVIHIDGDRTNNHFSNLEWATRRENAGTGRPVGHRAGSAHPRAKLDEDKVRDARRRYRLRQATVRALAHEHGVNPTTISAAIRGRTWAHVESEPH